MTHSTLNENSLAEALHDDAKAMALVKKFRLQVNPPLHPRGAKSWWVHDNGEPPTVGSSHQDLNRAIVECVAKMQTVPNSKRTKDTPRRMAHGLRVWNPSSAWGAPSGNSPSRVLAGWLHGQ
jgi:hypothetical protein